MRNRIAKTLVSAIATAMIAVAVHTILPHDATASGYALAYTETGSSCGTQLGNDC